MQPKNCWGSIFLQHLFTQGDAIPTSAATTGEIQNFGIMTSNAAGTAGDLLAQLILQEQWH